MLSIRNQSVIQQSPFKSYKMVISFQQNDVSFFSQYATQLRCGLTLIKAAVYYFTVSVSTVSILDIDFVVATMSLGGSTWARHEMRIHWEGPGLPRCSIGLSVCEGGAWSSRSWLAHSWWNRIRTRSLLWNEQTRVGFSSVHFVNIYALGKARNLCAPPRLSEVSPTFLKRFQCLSGLSRASLVLSKKIVWRFLFPRLSPPGDRWCGVLGFVPSTNSTRLIALGRRHTYKNKRWDSDQAWNRLQDAI